MTRTTKEKINLFRRCFSGLKHAYGTYDPVTRQVRQVKAPVTDQVIHDHLIGKQSYGVYLLVDDRISALAVDFDQDDLTAPMAFVTSALRYGLSTAIERSKSKGYHVWLFFEGWVLARKARRVVTHILEEIERPRTEIFPKQDSLDIRTCYGNFINAPLCGSWVRQGRTVFVDPADPTKPCSDPWQLLETFRRVPESVLDQIIAINQLDPETPIGSTHHPEMTGGREFNVGLAPCARRILAEGVSDFQRVTCFRLAVQLHRLGLPLDMTIAALKIWAGKNRPVPPKRTICDQEIAAQAADAYEKGYKGFGCSEPAISAYCDPQCPIHQKRNPI